MRKILRHLVNHQPCRRTCTATRKWVFKCRGSKLHVPSTTTSILTIQMRTSRFKRENSNNHAGTFCSIASIDISILEWIFKISGGWLVSTEIHTRCYGFPLESDRIAYQVNRRVGRYANVNHPSCGFSSVTKQWLGWCSVFRILMFCPRLHDVRINLTVA